MAFEIEDPSTSKKESLTFQILALMQLNRIAELCSYAKGEPESSGRLRLSLKKSYGALRFFDAMIWEKTSRQYKALVRGNEEVKGFRDKCNPKKLDSPGVNYEDYFDDLMLWAEEQSTQFKFIGIVQPKRETMTIITREGLLRLVDEVFGEGKVKIEFLDEKKEAEEIVVEKETEKIIEDLNEADI
jgi:hypothetical protein